MHVYLKKNLQVSHLQFWLMIFLGIGITGELSLLNACI